MSNAVNVVTRDAIRDRRVEILASVGLGVLRYGLVFLLVLWGSFKFAAFEAEGIKSLVEHSPFLSWLYPLLGVRGTSDLIGVTEVSTGLLIATRRWLPRVSAYGSMSASFVFVITLSFLFTTPGVLEPTNASGGFLMKDILLLGAALYTAAEAWKAGAGIERV
jgi:uncharacterized membrane protein YkgB